MNRTILERINALGDERSPRDIARFAARWTLRALGVKEKDITNALRTAARRAALAPA